MKDKFLIYDTLIYIPVLVEFSFLFEGVCAIITIDICIRSSYSSVVYLFSSMVSFGNN